MYKSMEGREFWDTGRSHRSTKRNSTVNCCNTFTCKIPNCNFTMHSKFELSSHISQHIQKKEYVKYPLKPCNQNTVNFTKISTWRVHLNRKHSNLNKSAIGILPSETCHDETSDVLEQHLDDNTNLITDCLQSPTSSQTNYNYSVKSLALLYLMLQTKFFVSNRALTTAIDGIKDMHEILCQDIVDIIKKKKYKLQDQDVVEISFVMYTIVHTVHYVPITFELTITETI
jgi:hypothetical protein